MDICIFNKYGTPWVLSKKLEILATWELYAYIIWYIHMYLPYPTLRLDYHMWTCLFLISAHHPSEHPRIVAQKIEYMFYLSHGNSCRFLKGAGEYFEGIIPGRQLPVQWWVISNCPSFLALIFVFLGLIKFIVTSQLCSRRCQEVSFR